MALSRKTIHPNDDGTRRLIVHRRDDGLFSYDEETVEMDVDDDPELGLEGMRFWTCSSTSGLHDSLNSLEAEARSNIRWFSERNLS